MSTLHASDLDATSRSDLIARAEALGIDKADVLTRAELVDEIVKRTVADPIERRLARGLLGLARDLVARVVERGLHLPDAAALIRGLQQVTLIPLTPPIATVTLAEIYAGQGHRARALSVLDEVLTKEPEHAAARALREKVAAQAVDAAPAIAPSEPPPSVEASAAPAATRAARAAARDRKHDRAADHDHDPDHDPDHDHDHDHDHDRDPDHDPDHDPDDDGDRLDVPPDRDTLPPPADVSPTLVPTDLAEDRWRMEASNEVTTESARPTEIGPPSNEDAAGQIVLLPVDATSVLARWELGVAALDEARARAVGGELILRIVAVTPSWDGPKVEIRDIEIAMSVGDWWVCDLPSAAVLRAAIGWRGDSGFDPLAVALDVAPPREGEPVLADESASRDFSDVTEQRRTGIEERARRRAEQGRPAEGRDRSSWRALALAPWEAPYDAPAVASIETR